MADPAGAQDAAAQPDQPVIVVPGEGLPLPPGTPAYGTVVIAGEPLAAEASGRTENLLRDIAGIQQFRRSDSRSANPSAQGLTVRGLGGNASSRTLVLADGVPLSDPFFGYIPFSAVPLDRLAAVRVTRGGGAGAFGAGAVAGTVELVSAPFPASPQLSATALGGGEEALELAAMLSAPLGGGAVSLSVRHDSGAGFDTTPPGQRVAATVPAAYEALSGQIQALVPVSADTDLTATMRAWRDDRTLRFAGADSFSEGQDASLRLVSRGRWAWEALAYLQLRDFGNRVVSATSFRPVLDQRATPSTGAGGKLELRPPVGDSHVLRLGVDARLARSRTLESPISAVTGRVTARREGGGESLVAGLFVEDDWQVGETLVLTGGLRLDRWTLTDGRFVERSPAGNLVSDMRFADRDGTEPGGRVGLVWNPASALALRAAAYTGFRLPTLNELYRPFTVFPVTTRANAALAPERLRGAEIGADWQPLEGATLSVTAFANRLENAIANVTIGTNLRMRDNLEAIDSVGIESSASYTAGPLRLAASHAWVDATVDGGPAAPELAGRRPAQVPAHTASLSGSWLPDAGPGGALTLRYVGPQFEDDLETDRLPGVLTVDAFLRWRLGSGLALVARAENLLDATIVTRNAGGSLDIGTPRTVWLGVQAEIGR